MVIGVMDVAQGLSTRLLVQTFSSTVKHYGAEKLISLICQMGGEQFVSGNVIIHLDHCNHHAIIRQCYCIDLTSKTGPLEMLGLGS